MAAGTKYNINPEFKPEEIYRVETGVRKSGPWKLDTTNLTPGTILPVFTPVEANLKTRVITVVRNVVVCVAAAAADTTLKIAKGSLVYKGMFLGDGKKGGEVTAIDLSLIHI